MTVVVVMMMVVASSLMMGTTSALSVPSGKANFDRCANSTYACLAGSVEAESGRLNYTVAYCCCNELFTACKRTLGCDAAGGSAATSVGGTSTRRMKGSAESCSYLRNQESKMRREKVCPPESTLKADCPSGGAPFLLGGPSSCCILAFPLIILFLLMFWG